MTRKIKRLTHDQVVAYAYRNLREVLLRYKVFRLSSVVGYQHADGGLRVVVKCGNK